MAAIGRTEDSLGEERLPTVHRTIRLPAELWRAVKRRSKQDKKALRRLVDETLDAELLPLVDALRDVGLRPGTGPSKLVRMPLDDNIVGRLNHASRETGLPAVLLLRICLRRFLSTKE